jgi:superfamily I DNA and/or RNA helicase
MMVNHLDSIGEFRDLLDYYISCLEKEDTLSLTFNYRLEGKKFHSNIFKKEQYFSHKKEQVKIKKTPEIKNVFKNYKLLQKNMPIFYGYPLFMDSNGNVSPIFFVEILFEEKDDTIIFTKESVASEFNHYILTKQGYNVEEINKIRLEMEEEQDFSIKLQKIIELLNLDKKTISSELEQKPLIVKTSSQLINKAILYFGGRMGFTRGLVDELQKLKKSSQYQLESTSLRILFDKEKYGKQKNKKDLLEIFNLNESQEKAVEKSFSNNISVITGPPGTGKSQVVLNIIANAVWNDKTVLFASKNNRAVDIVNEKLKTILSKDLIVRMGSGKHRKNAKLQIHKLFQDKDSLKISPEFKENQQEISRLNTTINELKSKINYSSNLNSEIDKHQGKINTLISSLPHELKEDYQKAIYDYLDKWDIKRDIRSLHKIMVDIKSCNEKIKIKKDNLREIITKNNISTKLYELFERHKWNDEDILDLKKDIKLLSIEDNFIKKIIRRIFPTSSLNKEYNIFKKYYEKLDKNVKNYFDDQVEFNSENIKINLNLILIFKQVSQLNKKITIFNNNKNELTTKKKDILARYYLPLPNQIKKFFESSIKKDDDFIKQFLGWMIILKDVNNSFKEIAGKKKELILEPSIYHLQSKIAEAQTERIKLSRNIFENYWFEKIKKTSSDDENHVSRYIDASEKLERYIEDYTLWKQLVGEQESEIQKMLHSLPIWVVTNLSVKNSLPLTENLFDLLIIDEASQCDIASALPLFYRAKQIVIIGDPKQLKHISILKETDDKKLASKNKISKLYLDYAYSKNSLYDLVERTIKSKKKLPTLLNQHYRSHNDIISFSNEYFYEKKLNIMTDESKLTPNKVHPNGIKWIDVRGKTSQTKSPYNKEEAIEIIKILKSFQKSKLKKISFGIVTLFRAQMELITNMINKTKELNEMDIVVGTTHRFQGDEKDIIIFSPAISQGIKQTTLNWIRTTSQLLNVAITRAKSVLLIVGDKKKCNEAGDLLKNLLEYVESKKQLEINFDSPIEEKLFKKLTKEGIKVFPQYETKVKGGKPYRLDFALFINENKYDLEIDGDKAHSQKIESDILRDIHLKIDGWKVRRFQAREINNSMDKVIEEIKRLC